ncbi:uncharacterized protein LOC130965645 [Arachis stenosperma]|uniref:uncharacterized protein LOC130965645 n=1 Tax=Arachis stenosperma TaxID=217475 RepID=UPI0025AD66D5|nr:uncharacterized protein LOC130965645 [Arachis stenosperma]
MEGTANLVVYRDGEIIRNTHEGVRFVCQNPFSFVVPCTMTFMELQNGLRQSMENGTLMRVSTILYRNPVVVFGGLIQFDIMPITNEVTMHNMFQIHRQTQIRQPQIELYVEFETVEAEGIQNDLEVEDDRAAVYERMNSNSKDDFEATYEAGDEDEDGDVGVETAVDNVMVHPSISQPMNVPPFMRELDLDAMHAPEFPEYSNIGVADPEDGEFRIGMEYSSRKSVVAAIRSYTIARGVDYDVYESESQTFYAKCKLYGRGCDRLIRASSIRKKDHSKLDSDTVVEAIRPLVETDPSIKVKTIIAEVQSRFNYTISYRKAWLVKQKSIAKVFGDWEENYQALSWWLSVMDGNQNIVPIAFALVEGETTDAWHFFLRNLHIDSNFLRAFKVLHLQKLVVNIGYSRTVEEYNINYKRLEERGEAYARWCDAIGYWYSTRDIDGTI